VTPEDRLLVLLVRDGAVVVPVLVQPGASRDALVGIHDGALKVAVKAPPVDGAANERCRKFLARQILGCPASRVVLIGGARARRKRFQVRSGEPEEIRSRIETVLAGEARVRLSSEP